MNKEVKSNRVRFKLKESTHFTCRHLTPCWGGELLNSNYVHDTSSASCGTVSRVLLSTWHTLLRNLNVPTCKLRLIMHLLHQVITRMKGEEMEKAPCKLRQPGRKEQV